MKKMIIGILLALVAMQLQAKEVIIRGSPSCGDWVEAKKEANQPSWKSIVFRSWLVGFLSGLAEGREIELLRGTDNESLFLWMDNYCNSNPISDVHDGGKNLSVELFRKNKSKSLK